ncbi:MAG: sigma-70 family RNA polymerase sigma factor [Sedimentisphaerales bacterium]|nr:sigma-70 family RNA polymerase sigma factor [Sedimentisphaerales bacterium]
MTRPSDKILVEAVFEGEKAAFEELYDRYGPLVRAVCYDTTGNIADAQDLAQDVFMRAFGKIKNLREPDLFARWIVSIARFRCKEWQREKSNMHKKHMALSETYEASIEQSNDGQLQELRVNIRKLPTQERLALHIFYLQENSVEDARRILNLSRSGFYRVLEKARKNLAILLSKESQDVQ